VPAASCEGLIRNYLELHGREPGESGRLLQVIRRLRLEELDLLTLALLESHLPSQAFTGTHAVDDDRLMAPYDKIRNLTDFYVVFCRERLGGKQQLTQAAELAYRVTMSENAVNPNDVRTDKGWRLLHWHPTIRSFLVAWH